jgi:hypothetical protein
MLTNAYAIVLCYAAISCSAVLCSACFEQAVGLIAVQHQAKASNTALWCVTDILMYVHLLYATEP